MFVPVFVLIGVAVELGHALKFGLLGDSGGLPLVGVTNGQLKVSASMAKLAAVPPGLDLVLGLGDNIYFTGAEDVKDSRFHSSFEYPYDYRSLETTWLMIAGNHDHFGNITAQTAYQWEGETKKCYKCKHYGTFPSLYYLWRIISQVDKTSVDIIYIDTIVLCGNTRDLQAAGFWTFLSSIVQQADVNPPGPADKAAAEKQWDWLEDKLNESATRGVDYIFVAGHYPIYSISSHGPTKCLVDRLLPLLQKYRVSAYFAGHDHTLQHIQIKDKTNQTLDLIVSGAASRADSKTDHLDDVNNVASVKYHYPEEQSWLDWLTFNSLNQLGINDGAFIMMDVDKHSARFDFRDLDGNHKYTTEIFPRIP